MNLTIKLKNSDSFKKILIKKGYTYKSFAKEVEVSQPFISGIISGKKNPSPKVARKIADVLQIDWDDIFFIQNDNKM